MQRHEVGHIMGQTTQGSDDAKHLRTGLLPAKGSSQSCQMPIFSLTHEAQYQDKHSIRRSAPRRGISPEHGANARTLCGNPVESGADAVTVGYGGCSVAFAPGLSPSPLVPFPDPRSSNRTCGFPASGFRTRSCLRARKGHGLPRETQEAVICAQPLFGVSHESPRPRLVLSTEPLA